MAGRSTLVQPPAGRGARLRSVACGVTLPLVLLVLGALALAAAAAVQLTAGSHKVASHFRMQAQALEAAQAALAFCQAQLLLPEGQRSAGLSAADLPQTQPEAPAWQEPGRWAGSLPGPAGLFEPGPVCLAERRALPGGSVHVVTARGLSPDWRGDAAGAMQAGAEVWLQAVLLIDAGQLRQRVQRRLLQAPV